MSERAPKKRRTAIVPLSILSSALAGTVPLSAMALASACSSDDGSAGSADAFSGDVSAHFNDVYVADVSAHFDVFTGDVSAHFDASDAARDGANEANDAIPDAPADGDSGEEAG